MLYGRSWNHAVTDTPTVTDMMVAYSEDAVDHARTSSGVVLDYTPESVERVETILREMYSGIPKGFFARIFKRGPTQEMIWSMCKVYGGYVGEVLRREKGGEWSFDNEIVPGTSTICLSQGTCRIWPPAKVFKRLTNGGEDNVWHYFTVVRRDWVQ